VHINNQANDAFAPRDIRRFPSELDYVPSRNAAKNGEIGRKPTYSEVVASVEGANGATGADSIPTEPSSATNGKPFSLWEKEDFGFGDFIDIINPLHHIPIVATIYRNLSADQIGAVPRVIGGAIWGRIGGFVSGVVNAIVEWWSGKDIGDHVYAAVFGDPKKIDGDMAVAQMKTATVDAAPSAVATRNDPALPSAATAGVTAVETPSAAAPESDGAGPTALRSELPAILASSARVALSSYERNLQRGKLDESLGIRLPA